MSGLCKMVRLRGGSRVLDDDLKRKILRYVKISILTEERVEMDLEGI